MKRKKGKGKDGFPIEDRKKVKRKRSEENNGMKEGKVTEGEEKKRLVGENFFATAYKDNMDVVSREDLKSVFEKFGTVKVIELPPSSIL